MSRRRNDVDHENTVLDILCPRGHRVGMVVKHRLAHPRAGSYSTYRGVRHEDVPFPTDDSGKVRGTCPQCGAEVQHRWDRVRPRLDAMDESGRHTGELRG